MIVLHFLRVMASIHELQNGGGLHNCEFHTWWLGSVELLKGPGQFSLSTKYISSNRYIFPTTESDKHMHLLTRLCGNTELL